MRMHWLAKLGAVAVALSPVAGSAALLAPHNKSFTDGDCENCHNLYDSTILGGLDYSAGCNGCHATKTGSTLSFPTTTTEAKPGVKGTHHSWTGFVENPQYGSSKPVNPLVASKLVDGQRLQCAVCHDLHTEGAGSAPSSVYTVPGVGVGTVPNSNANLVTPGTERLTIVTPGSLSRGYRVKLVATNAYIISTAAGVSPIQWLNFVAGAWVPGIDNPPVAQARTFTAGNTHLLNPAEPTGMSISLSATGVVGDQWDVLVTFPGLRVTTIDDQICVSCHKPMEMNSNRVAGHDTAYPVDGTRLFGHPTGEALGANGLNSDRTAILDANGATQTAGDGNPTNDLVLRNGVVRCTTCHAVHGADSNSQTVDVR
jgi:hypothetical protein